jgi:hypothetical protein
MPGFDGTGPQAMGSMTGGGRGLCNPYIRVYGRGGFESRFGSGRGRGRGYRHAYRATGLPRWMRSVGGGAWDTGFSDPYSREQEEALLKDRVSILRQELEAIERRIQSLSQDQRDLVKVKRRKRGNLL